MAGGGCVVASSGVRYCSCPPHPDSVWAVLRYCVYLWAASGSLGGPSSSFVLVISRRLNHFAFQPSRSGRTLIVRSPYHKGIVQEVRCSPSSAYLTCSSMIAVWFALSIRWLATRFFLHFIPLKRSRLFRASRRVVVL